MFISLHIRDPFKAVTFIYPSKFSKGEDIGRDYFCHKWSDYKVFHLLSNSKVLKCFHFILDVSILFVNPTDLLPSSESILSVKA